MILLVHDSAFRSEFYFFDFLRSCINLAIKEENNTLHRKTRWDTQMKSYEVVHIVLSWELDTNPKKSSTLQRLNFCDMKRNTKQKMRIDEYGRCCTLGYKSSEYRTCEENGEGHQVAKASVFLQINWRETFFWKTAAAYKTADRNRLLSPNPRRQKKNNIQIIYGYK